MCIANKRVFNIRPNNQTVVQKTEAIEKQRSYLFHATEARVYMNTVIDKARQSAEGQSLRKNDKKILHECTMVWAWLF